MTGITYIMVVSLVPKERYGVSMGIVNMMIVVRMLIETVTFASSVTHGHASTLNGYLPLAGCT